MTSLRHRLKQLVGLELSESLDVSLPHAVLGTDYGNHAVALDGLSPESVVYSFGIGEDVSFDLALMERVGLTIHGFDPTPRSLAWVEQAGLPSTFHMHGYGLATHDGVVRFAPPKNPAHVSHSIVHEGASSGASSRGPGAEQGPGGGSASAVVELPVRRLSTILAELGHTRLDVLKMDIEGFEYDVIDDVLQAGHPVSQWLIEFHHGHYNIPVAKTRAAIATLRGAGFKLFRCSSSGHELSFIRA